MASFNTDCAVYLPPVGEELQHEFCDADSTVSLHTDSYLLSRLSDSQLSQSVLEMLQSRLQPIADSFSPELRESFDKLSDWSKMDITPSRYAQFLSDKMQDAKNFFDKFDSEQSELSKKADADKLEKARHALRDFVLRFADDSDN